MTLNFRLRFFPIRAAGCLALAATAFLAGCSSAPQTPAPVVPPVATTNAAKVPPRLGLALGGGAARGFAHVGVIQALEEAGIKPDFVTGTSAGSLVAALYASGRSGAQLQQVADTMEEVAFTDWTLPIFSRGVFRGEALSRYVNAQVGNRPIESLPMRLGIVATDLKSGQGVLFERGDTGTAVRASSAVPAIFVPVSINGREYVDGGLVAPVPVHFAKKMGAEVVVAVDISASPESGTAGDTFQLLLQTFAIMGRSINNYELKEADIVVRPALKGLNGADFRTRVQAVEAGRNAMRQMVPQLKALMEARSH